MNGLDLHCGTHKSQKITKTDDPSAPARPTVAAPFRESMHFKNLKGEGRTHGIIECMETWKASCPFSAVRQTWAFHASDENRPEFRSDHHYRTCPKSDVVNPECIEKFIP